MSDWKEGGLKRYYKSEKEPSASDNPGPVYKVVGDSFKRIVLESDNDVIVKYYSPQCGACKKFKPIYE